MENFVISESYELFMTKKSLRSFYFLPLKCKKKLQGDKKKLDIFNRNKILKLEAYLGGTGFTITIAFIQLLTEHNCTKYQYKSCQLSATLLLNQHSFANYCHVLSLLLSQVLSLSTTIALHYGASKRKQQGQRCICMFRFVCPM